MSQPLLLKVYGNLWPCGQKLQAEIAQIGLTCLPDACLVRLEGNLLTISFEGIYFPLEECLAAIETQLSPDQNGKLDYINLEEWRLTRFIFKNGQTAASSAPLNNVMDYSGH